MKNKLLYALLSVGFFSCAISSNIKPTSELALNVRFPQKFSIKTMPDATEKIHIKISGVNLDKPEERDITRKDAGSVIIKGLPIGKKNIEVEGFDLNNKLIAKGSKDTTIEAGKVVTEKVELFGLSQKLQLKFENYPENAELAILEVKGKSAPIYKEFNSDTLDLDSLPNGDYNIRVTVFNSNSVPIAHKKTTITLDSAQKNIVLDKIKLPEISEVTTGLVAVPKELFEVLNSVLIEVPNNNKPKYETPVLYINGVEQKVLPIDNTNPICVKKGDTLKVSVKTADTDVNDKVRIFWGVNSRNDDDSLTFKLLDEYSNDLVYPVNFDVGTNHSLGFLLTDKKSYVGPFSIYFKVCE